MVNIRVCCKPIFYFSKGTVTGWIEIDPDSILDAIYMNIALEYKGQHRLSAQNLISSESSRRMNEGKPAVVIQYSGIVDKNFVCMTLHEAMDLILDYIHFDDVVCDRLSNKREAQLWKDICNLKDYIYRCDSCNFQHETANITIEY